jgi:hypothetical protein
MFLGLVPCQKPHVSRGVVAKGSRFSRVCSLTEALFLIPEHSCEFEKPVSRCFKRLEVIFPSAIATTFALPELLFLQLKFLL